MKGPIDDLTIYDIRVYVTDKSTGKLKSYYIKSVSEIDIGERAVAFYNGHDLPALLVNLDMFSHYLIIQVIDEKGEVVDSVKSNDKTENIE